MSTGLQLLREFIDAAKTVRSVDELCEIGAATAAHLTGAEHAIAWIVDRGMSPYEHFVGAFGLEPHSSTTLSDWPRLIEQTMTTDATSRQTNVPREDLGLPGGAPFASVDWVTVRQSETIACWVGVMSSRAGYELDHESTSLLQILAQHMALVHQAMDVVSQPGSAEFRYRRFIEELPALTYARALDKPGEAGFISPQSMELLGFEPEEFVGNRDLFAERLHPEDRERVLMEQAAHDPTKTTTIDTHSFRMLHKDGHIVWLLNHLRTIRAEDGTPKFVTGLIIDVTETEERARENAAHAAAEEIRRRIAEDENLAKGRFLASMSHEIRTPMNAILGYAQLLQRELGLTERQRDYLEIIDRSGEHLLSLINDVLDMAKIESGKVSVTSGEVDFSRMLLDIERMFRLKVSEKGVALTLEKTPEVPPLLLTDAGKVRQVLINLLSNATKFTDKGRVVMRISVLERTNGEVRLLVVVEDTGHGIAPEALEDIFGAFVQTAVGSQKTGTGLGLAVSRQFARLLGGDLSATSVLGAGSVFRFEFVAQEASNPRARPHQRQVIGLVADKVPPQILVVDDNADNRAVLTRLLRTVGFIVRTASSGEEALEIFTSERADIALLDRRMPGMDGLDLIGHLRTLSGEAPLLVITVSASALDQDRDEALAAGADNFLCKPIRETELFGLLENHSGVQYLYAEDEPEAAGGGPAASSLDASSIRSLPKDLLDDLRQAVRGGLIQTIEEHIERTEQLNPPLGRGLRRLADNFDYPALLELLEDPGPQ